MRNCTIATHLRIDVDFDTGFNSGDSIVQTLIQERCAKQLGKEKNTVIRMFLKHSIVAAVVDGWLSVADPNVSEQLSFAPQAHPDRDSCRSLRLHSDNAEAIIARVVGRTDRKVERRNLKTGDIAGGILDHVSAELAAAVASTP